VIFVTLGEILFNGAEVPEVINGGGSQLQSIHQLIGGLRIVDTLGRSDIDISLKGIFSGIASVERVKYLDYLRISGNQVSFNYSQYSYLVVVKSLAWNMRMAYQIGYEITLTVVQDLNTPVTIAIPTSFSDEILGAYITALDLATLINDGGILGAMGVIGIALEAAEAVGGLENATAAEIAAISSAISSASTAVNGVIGNL
jgi:hypothetical protein